MFVLLFYSTAMPIYYCVGFVFFVFTMFAHKVLLFKQCTKTDHMLREQVPFKAMNLIAVAITLKILAGFVVFCWPDVWETQEKLDHESLVYKLKFNLGE